MLERAQEKVNVINRAKQATAGARPIDEVIFVQNCSMYNLDWAHAREGKSTAFLTSLVSQYMDELMQKDKKLVMSARAFETIYHTFVFSGQTDFRKTLSGRI